MAPGHLALELLAERTGESPERLSGWEACGVIARVGDHFASDSVERVRLLTFAERRGILPDAIADAAGEQGDVLAHVLELGSSPDTGHVSTGGKLLWLSGRDDDAAFAIDTTSRKVTSIPVD